MRIITSLFLSIVFIANFSCSKQEIEDTVQSPLTDIIQGTWNVTSVKYRQEIGLAFFTHKSITQLGSFTFTADSTYHNVNFAYLFALNDSIGTIPVGGNSNQNGYYSFAEDPDKLDVQELTTGFPFVYETYNRTANTMTLIYEDRGTDVNGVKLVDRYTFDLVKQ